MIDYEDMIENLKNMDGKQLTELFHDIEDIQQVERIAEHAYLRVLAHEKKKNANCHSIGKGHGFGLQGGKCIDCGFDSSESREAREIDDARRGREYKSDKRPY